MKSFLAGKKQLDSDEAAEKSDGKENVSSDAESHLNALEQQNNVLQAPEENCSAQVETISEDGKIKKIIVKCECGKESVLVCNY